ncbi:hypothetical protein B1812_03325 [Methylocystis bryophila]|uniref:Uncharacterized protein n=1 Tax=Methylocystis bryophila TaxID=655015 RepID=A0A1W6MRS9_9HYPH|nr:hypothetical protein B1812_03325 [Methylocystis bryophila]
MPRPVKHGQIFDGVVAHGLPLCKRQDEALARFPLERNRSSDKESRQIKRVEHVTTGKPLRTFPLHALSAILGYSGAPEIQSDPTLPRPSPA